MTTTEIRPMTPADVAPATTAILRADWGDRRAWFEFATTHDECRPIVAEIDGEVAGTGVGTRNGSVGWVGTIFVAASRRGRGLGRALTQAVMDGLEDAGCRTLLLVATRTGRLLYERLGFELQTWYVTMEGSGTMEAPDSGVRAFAPGDLGTMAALDAAATGEDRRHLLERFATPGSARVLAGPGGPVEGFVVRAPWGGGATIAPDPAAAVRILESRRAGQEARHLTRAGLTAENVEGLERLAALGWTRGYEAPRMIRGEALDWRPDSIWGQFNMAIG